MDIFIRGKNGYTAFSKRLEDRGFGVRRGAKLILHPVEVLYLALKEDVNVIMNNRVLDVYEVFEWVMSIDDEILALYYAFEDLRRRGYRVRVIDNLLIYKYVFLPVFETKELSIVDLAKRRLENLVLAIVDEESELTYYRVEEVDIRGRNFHEDFKAKGKLIGNRVIVNLAEIYTRYFYGSYRNDVVELSLMEALYLMERGNLRIFSNQKELYEDDVREIAKRFDRNFERRYEVYKDLKERGFVVKTGFKFGCDFRVYEEVLSVENLPHSKYLVSIVDDKKMKAFEIARAVRLAHNVRKDMIFTYKENNKNRYILIKWIKV